MDKRFDLVIVGAGPGGLSAAVSARSSGMSVLVLNEQDHIGGQIYHSLETVTKENKAILGEDYLSGHTLISDFKNCGAHYLPRTNVITIEPGKFVVYQTGKKIVEVLSGQVILSVGAMERPVPIPGWTLPGVMAAASVDVLLKQSDVIPSGKVVFAGSGPLMLSVACHLIDCGVKIEAIIDTSSFKNKVTAIPHVLGALSKPGLLIKGFGMLTKIRKAGIPVIKGASDIQAMGDDRLESVRFGHKSQSKILKTDLLLLHEGVIPNTQMSRLSGCVHEWYTAHQYWKPVIDKWGQSSVENLSLVGDCTGIFGAKVAEYAGHIAGINSAFKGEAISQIKRDEAASPYFKARKKEMRIRPFIDTVYQPNSDMIIPKDPNTIVCRCEEIRLVEILEAIDSGYKKPATIKNKTRSGMGRCQGRMCGTIVTQVLARQLSLTPEQIGYYHIRSMIKPVTLSQLGNMDINKEQK
jgi:thioredoxin reductase